MAVFGPFFGPWMAKSCQKRSPRFDNFPTVSSDFLHFLTTLRPWFEPVLLSIFIHILLQKKHNTAHNIHNTQPHTRTHTQTHLPLTVILRVVCVRVTRGKTAKNAWKRQSQGNLWRRLVSGKSFVCGEVAKDESNHIGAGSLRSFPHSQEKRKIYGTGHASFSTYSQTLQWARSCGNSPWTSRASDNSTWTNLGKHKIGDEGRT